MFASTSSERSVFHALRSGAVRVLDFQPSPRAAAFVPEIHSLRDDIGFGWAQDHSHWISTKGSHGTDLPAVIKVRVARSDEKAAYAAKGKAESYRGVTIVYLVDLNSLSPARR